MQRLDESKWPSEVPRSMHKMPTCHHSDKGRILPHWPQNQSESRNAATSVILFTKLKKLKFYVLPTEEGLGSGDGGRRKRKRKSLIKVTPQVADMKTL